MPACFVLESLFEGRGGEPGCWSWRVSGRWVGRGDSDSQVVWPRPDAAALAGPAESPRVYANRHRGLVQLHSGGGDVARILLALLPARAVCVGGRAGAAAAAGAGGGGDVGV